MVKIGQRHKSEAACIGFINWMKVACKDNPELLKHLQEFTAHFNNIVQSYRDEIAELRNEKEV